MRVSRFLLTLAAIVLISPSWAVAGPRDEQIAEAVISQLSQEKKAGNLKGFSIDIEVEDGVVWVSGRVPTKEQQKIALNIARTVPGVKQVVNDLTISTSATPAAPATADDQDNKSASAGGSKSILSGLNNAMKNAMFSKGEESSDVKQTQAEGPVPQIGSGLTRAPQPLTSVSTIQRQPMPAQMPAAAPQAYRQPQTPVAFASASTINRQDGVVYEGAAGGYSGQPVPMYAPGSGTGVTPARYDHPNMPNYSWPSYASHPNYAAVTYPKQYSASTWPYIGPFYPYPQVPLGWRKVTLEWDDGWWFLDFKDRRARCR